MLCSRCHEPCSPHEQDLATDIPLHVHGDFCAQCCVELGWASPSIFEQLDEEDDEYFDDE